MGTYFNPNPQRFRENLDSENYIDKTELISETNKVVNTMQRFMLISRPHGFGKTTDMNMLAAYYGCKYDTHDMFSNLKIGKDESFERHLNKYYVLQINIQSFVSVTKSVEEMLSLLETTIIEEVRSEIHDLPENYPLLFLLKAAYVRTEREFVLLIDDWDCIFSEYKDDAVSQKKVIVFLRTLMKDQGYVALGYMIGSRTDKEYGVYYDTPW